MKVYFFPGLGADASLARFHSLPGHDVEWVRWPRQIAPDWDGFIRDLLGANRIEEGAVYIGISFGGMAALELAARRKSRGVILVGSCRSSRSIAPLLRAFKPVVRFLPDLLFDVGRMPRGLAGFCFGIHRRDHIDLLCEMGRRLGTGHVRAASALALGFEAGELPGLPVYSVHGEKDWIIRARGETRDAIIDGAGHLVSLTHPDEVDARILAWLRGLEAG